MPDTDRAKVLVVDDDTAIRRLVARVLADDYEIVEAGDGPEAVTALSGGADLVVLDVGLPSGSGLELLASLRKSSEVPVILLTGNAAESDRIRGLDLGADDYVVKPFSPGELAARVRSVLRRAGGASAGPMKFDRLVIEPATRQVTLDGEVLTMTRLEFDLLAYLAAHPQVAYTRDDLLQKVWSSSAQWQDPATVTEHIRRLRLKIERDPNNPQFLKTVRGAGYLFDPGGAAGPASPGA